MSNEGVAVVTGANRGIGRAVAAELARRGRRVVLVVRDRAAGEAAAIPGAEVVAGDLSERARVRAVAEELLGRYDRIDVLVHNAGVWPTRLVRTAEGFEQAFAVNHLAPFLLNHLLEEWLRAGGARVVQVSAGLHVKGRVDLERTPTGRDFHRMRTYCTTKLANLLTVAEFARRWRGSGATIGAVHPGVIRTGLGDPGGLLGVVLGLVKRTWGSPEEGAAPVVRLALDPGDPAGGYFEVDRPAAVRGADPELARRVWAQAAELTGVGVVP